MPDSDDARAAGERISAPLGWRRFLGVALGAAGVVAQSCSTRVTSTATAPRSAASTTSSTSTTTPSTTSTSTSTSTSTTSTSTTTTSTTTTTTEPIDDGAEAVQDALGLERPTPPGAYDREALYVALYGFPSSSILGALGEQGVDAAVLRAQEVAAAYEGFGPRVVPTFEILASVASASPGEDGDYSNEFDTERFRPWIRAAAEHDMHVVFDLQSGRSRFPDQARQYEALWLAPNTSVALDPEWRVGPNDRPQGGRIGSVDAAEVNETIDYLDEVVASRGLPPKLCIVHQFADSMITNKALIRGSENIQVLLQMDGFGSLDLKHGSWGRMVDDLPEGAFAGWKNFYDEDRPTPTPAETMANEPQPRYVSFQ